MDLFKFFTSDKIEQKGQSTVEYILLFAVVATLVTFVFKSKQFQDLFGDEGKFANIYKKEIEYSYRHGLGGREPFTQPDYKSAQHDSYSGRFFGAVDAYGK